MAGTREDYEIIKLLAEGVSAKVYYAQRKRDQKNVALKKYDPDYDDDMMEEERQFLEQAKHPNIVGYLGDFEWNYKTYLVLEYHCYNLADYMVLVNEPLPQDLIESYAFQLLLALGYMHDQCNWIHRDIKPANILLSADGGLKLADFGWARHLLPSHKHLTPGCTTLWYRPPEIIIDPGFPYSFNVDIWSFGCVYFELHQGEPPCDEMTPWGMTGGLLECLRPDPPPRNEAPFTEIHHYLWKKCVNPTEPLWQVKKIPPECWPLLEHTLEWKPSNRWSAKKLLKDIPWSQESAPIRQLLLEKEQQQ